MRNTRALLAVAGLLLVCAAMPQRAEAQGGMREWLRKLSGPKVEAWVIHWDFCGSLSCRDERWTFRPALGWSDSVSEEPAGTPGEIEMFLLEPAFVLRPGGKRRYLPHAYGFGLSAVYFDTEGFGSFWRFAPVVSAGYEIPIGNRFSFDFGVKGRIFTESFNGQDFGGTPTSNSGPEFNAAGYIGISFG